jgi:hypothetical protein
MHDPGHVRSSERLLWNIQLGASNESKGEDKQSMRLEEGTGSGEYGEACRPENIFGCGGNVPMASQLLLSMQHWASSEKSLG